jgi:hypothetical protein
MSFPRPDSDLIGMGIAPDSIDTSGQDRFSELLDQMNWAGGLFGRPVKNPRTGAWETDSSPIGKIFQRIFGGDSKSPIDKIFQRISGGNSKSQVGSVSIPRGDTIRLMRSPYGWTMPVSADRIEDALSRGWELLL